MEERVLLTTHFASVSSRSAAAAAIASTTLGGKPCNPDASATSVKGPPSSANTF